MLELAQREVYADYRGKIAQAQLLPLAPLATRSLQHPLSDGNDEPGLFGEGDELIGAYRAALRVLPTQEGFHPSDVIAHQGEHRLVVDPELVALDSLPEVVLQFQALQGVRVLAPVEDLVAGLALVLRPVQGYTRGP